MNSLNEKGCRYKELNVLTIKWIDEQLSPLPVFVYWLVTSSAQMFKLKVKYQTHWSSYQISLTEPRLDLSIHICLVSPQFIIHILLKYYWNITEILLKFSSSPIRYKSEQAWPLMMDEEKEEVWLDSPSSGKQKLLPVWENLAHSMGRLKYVFLSLLSKLHQQCQSQ